MNKKEYLEKVNAVKIDSPELKKVIDGLLSKCEEFSDAKRMQAVWDILSLLSTLSKTIYGDYKYQIQNILSLTKDFIKVRNKQSVRQRRPAKVRSFSEIQSAGSPVVATTECDGCDGQKHYKPEDSGAPFQKGVNAVSSRTEKLDLTDGSSNVMDVYLKCETKEELIEALRVFKSNQVSGFDLDGSIEDFYAVIAGHPMKKQGVKNTNARINKLFAAITNHKKKAEADADRIANNYDKAVEAQKKYQANKV